MKFEKLIALSTFLAMSSLNSGEMESRHDYDLTVHDLLEETDQLALAAAENNNEVIYYEDYLKTLNHSPENDDEKDFNEDDEDTLEIEEESSAEGSQLSLEQKLQQALSQAPTPEINMPKLSETFGNFLGKNLKNSGIEFQIEDLISGIRNGMENKPSPLSESEYESMMIAVQQQIYQKMSSDNLNKANAFMIENSLKDNIIELVPGKLQYEVLSDGLGVEVVEGNTPLINYTGKFADGSVFSSSEETGGPITIPLAHTIAGFQAGIKGMKEGEKRRLYIHPDQGYGAAAGHLPPNSLLIFDIEVVEANHEDDEVDDLDDSDVEPSDEDIDNSDVEDEEEDTLKQ